MVLFRRHRELGGCFPKRKKINLSYFFDKTKLNISKRNITLSNCSKFSTGECYVYNQ